MGKSAMDEATGKRLSLVIEALLFASERPLSAREIHFWLPEEDPSNILNALKELRAEYASLGRSFSLKEVAQGYQLKTKSDYAPYILRMLKTSPARLSQAALETLAIIAYKQPILRQEIERLRGVDVGSILRTLLEKELIRVMGRKNLPGRPLIYGTTKRFLEIFDLNDLESLPKLKEIRELGSDEEGSASFSEALQQEESPGGEKAEDGNTIEPEQVSTTSES
jgi:segregation and condensation protein B